MAGHARITLTSRQRMKIALDSYTSESSVRRWLQDPESVSESVRERIQQAVHEMGLDQAA